MNTLRAELVILAVANYMGHRVDRATEFGKDSYTLSFEDSKQLEQMLRSAWGDLRAKREAIEKHGTG